MLANAFSVFLLSIYVLRECWFFVSLMTCERFAVKRISSFFYELFFRDDAAEES